MFLRLEREREIRVPLLVLGFCTQKLSKDFVAHIAVYVNLLWDLWGAFLHISLGFSRRRSFLHLDDQSSCGHWSLKKHKQVCLYLVVNQRKKESVNSKLARGHVSKFYWWVAIRSRAWRLISLIVWTSIFSR